MVLKSTRLFDYLAYRVRGWKRQSGLPGRHRASILPKLRRKGHYYTDSGSSTIAGRADFTAGAAKVALSGIAS